MQEYCKYYIQITRNVLCLNIIYREFLSPYVTAMASMYIHIQDKTLFPEIFTGFAYHSKTTKVEQNLFREPKSTRFLKRKYFFGGGSRRWNRVVQILYRPFRWQPAQQALPWIWGAKKDFGVLPTQKWDGSQNKKVRGGGVGRGRKERCSCFPATVSLLLLYISQNFIMAHFAAFERSKLHQTFMTACISPQRLNYAFVSFSLSLCLGFY